MQVRVITCMQVRVAARGRGVAECSWKHASTQCCMPIMRFQLEPHEAPPGQGLLLRLGVPQRACVMSRSAASRPACVECTVV
jgi:hypothetical protein